MRVFGLDRSDARLILNIWRMNLADRYLGSALGGAWAILNPLFMFALFTFVFGFVFKARLANANSTLAYSIWLISGYGPWLAITEAFTSASNSVVGNAGLIKNMAFKTEVLPISATLLGLIPLAVSLVFLLLLQLMAGDGWSWRLLYLPLIISVQFIFLVALGLFLAIVNAFIRDFGIVLPNLLMILLFSTPIFYPVEAMPPVIRAITVANPFHIIVQAYRFCLLDNQVLPALSLLVMAAASILLVWVGLQVFRRIKGFLPSLV